MEYFLKDVFVCTNHNQDLIYAEAIGDDLDRTHSIILTARREFKVPNLQR